MSRGAYKTIKINIVIGTTCVIFKFNLNPSKVVENVRVLGLGVHVYGLCQTLSWIFRLICYK